jgi:uncharacterized protein YndB with AHSA1/START domain
MSNTIRQSFFFAHEPEVVWEYLTTAELLAQWLMPNDIEPVLGHEFRFTTHPKPGFNFDGIVYCKILEVDPLRKLSYSWKGGPGDGTLPRKKWRCKHLMPSRPSPTRVGDKY